MLFLLEVLNNKRIDMSLKNKLIYKFDNFMAKGAKSIFLALMIIFAIGFILLGVARVIVGLYVVDDATSGLEVWRIFLQLTDPGNMAQDNDTIWYLKIFTIIAGMFGVVFFSAVIAVITTQLDLKLENLKKGRSKVVEKNHILILGWGNEIVDIIRELVIANDTEGCVVILSEEEKEDMDDFLREQIPNRQKTRIITRRGEVGSIASLQRVAASCSKSIIILPTCSHGSSQSEKAHSDALTLKSMLAIIASCKEREGIPSVVAQVYNNVNREIIRTLSADSITIVDPEDIIAKIAVQTSRSSGLAAVYSSLIGFEGCEFYFTNSQWNNLTFSEIHYHYPDGVALGIRTNDGLIQINPPADYILKDDDDLILLAEDDSTINFKSKPVVKPEDYDFANGSVNREREKVLIIGWNNKAPIIISEYLDYIMEGSVIDVVLTQPDTEIEKAIATLSKSSNDHTIHLIRCDLMNIKHVLKLSPETYNSIVLLTESDLDQERADAATINILLVLREVINRKIKEGTAQKTPQIITEVLESDNLELISHTGANDAIISTKMVSKILSQIAEEPSILEVYNELFKEDGCEIYLKPVSLYFKSSPSQVFSAHLNSLRYCSLFSPPPVIPDS